MDVKEDRLPTKRMDRTDAMPRYDSQPSKRRRMSHTNDVINLLGPSRSPPPFVLPRSSRAPRSGLTNNNRQTFTLPISKKDNKQKNKVVAVTADVSVAKPSPAAAPLPKLKDSALTSENIEAALCLIDKNNAKKHDKFEEVLQSFHDLYRWSRLPNRDHRKFFQHEFVWELSGIPRVMKFLKNHNMGDEFLNQLLQTELPFNE